MHWVFIRRECCLKGFSTTCRDQSLLVTFVGLIEQEIGCELFVLIAGEVGLDDRVTREAEAAKLA